MKLYKYSWLTADTGESIQHVYSKHKTQPVYLLQPNNAKPIEETNYEGSGIFGGVNVHAWLALKNYPEETKGLTEDQLIRYGKGIIQGCYKDIRNGKFYSLKGMYPDTIPFDDMKMHVYGQGMTAKDLIKECLWIAYRPKLLYSLKFSFNKHANYDNLPESPVCPKGGYGKVRKGGKTFLGLPEESYIPTKNHEIVMDLTH